MSHARPYLAPIAAAALGAASCARGEAAPIEAAPARAAPAAAAQPRSALPRLVFFMNPNGRPCQVQDQILGQMAGQLAGKAEVVYVKTTEPADIAIFEQYGIRALPTLLVADASGREIRRAPPGIQTAAQVLQLLGP